MNKIKLTFCTDGIFPYTVGGMQRHSRLLLDELSHYPDLEITVIHPHKETIFPASTGIKEIKLQGIDPNKNYLKESYGYSRDVFSEIEKLNSDIVYAQGFSVWYGLDKIKAATIINPHGLEPFQSLSLKDKLIAIPFKKVFKKLFNQADYVVSLGGGLTQILEKQIRNDQTKIVVLPNATNLPQEEVSREFGDKTRALFVGRFASNKGIHILFKAIEDINNSGEQDNFEFTLAGKGPLYEEYISKYKFPNVTFAGFVDDDKLKDLYLQNDLFVLPTLFEGMPTVVLEAMSYKMPVIVTDVGATAEQVSRENGYLIDKNSPEQLRDTLLHFHQLPTDKKQDLAEAARKKLEDNFTWKVVGEKHHELFRSIVEQGK